MRQEKGEFVQDLITLFEKGFRRIIIDEKIYKFQTVEEIQALKLGKTYKHTIDVIIDTVTVSNDQDDKTRLDEAVEKACGLAQGLCKIIIDLQSSKASEILYSTNRMCLDCGMAFAELEPRMFSFNSPLGACTECHGIGLLANDYYWRVYTDEVDKALTDGASENIMICPNCTGKRLNPQALAVTVSGKNIYELSELSITKAVDFFNNLNISEHEKAIVARLLDEITNRLQFLQNVGLGYLSLGRTARTLSGGEGQRIRLARQLGSALSGVLYILDEPSIGLHQKDNDQLSKHCSICAIKATPWLSLSMITIRWPMLTISLIWVQLLGCMGVWLLPMAHLTSLKKIKIHFLVHFYQEKEKLLA